MDRLLRARNRARFLVLLSALVASSAFAAGTIDLAWDPVNHPGLAGYRVYYGVESGAYTQSFDVGPLTAVTVTNLPSCTRYHLAVASLEADGTESVSPSNEVSGWPRPTVESVAPTSVTQGQTVSITIDGDNIRSGTTLEFDDPAVTVVSRQVTGCDRMVVELSVGAEATPGPLDFDIVHDDRVYSTVSEGLNVLPDAATLLPKSGWRIHNVSSEDLQPPRRHPADHAIDGDADTYWHTRYEDVTDGYPHFIVIDLGDVYDVDAVRLLPRQDGSDNGRFSEYRIFLSDSVGLGAFRTPVATGTLEDHSGLQRVEAVATGVRYLRLGATEEINGNPWASLAEIDVEGRPHDASNAAPDGQIVEPMHDVVREAGQIVVFSAVGSDPEDGQPSAWHWDFGDPTIPDETSQNPGLIRFDVPGVYTVTLTVYDSEGRPDPSPATVTITVTGDIASVNNLRRTDVKAE